MCLLLSTGVAMTPLSSSSTPKPKQRVSSAAAATTPSIQTYLFKIQNEKEQIESIIAQTEALVAEQSRHRKLLGNDNARSDESCMLQIQMLENRLNDALVKFNTKVQGNKSLRDLIGVKRRDRCIYDEIYTKLEREIQRQTQQMRRELDQTKITLELRHQAQKELEIAKSQLQENKAALELDRNELGKLREQLKGKEGTGEAEERSFRPKTTSANGSSVAPSTQEEDKFNDGMQDGIQEEKKLDALLDQVRQSLGIDNVDTLIERLAEIEERNFSRFQYITELEAEARSVGSDIINAARELERLKNRGLNHQMQQINERELAKQKQQMLIDKSRDLDKQYEAQVELWEKMRKGIAQVHSALGLPM